MAKMEHGFLSAIHQPERLGEACEYIQNAVDLMGKTSKLGLPNLFSIDFISPYVGIEENLTLGVKVYPNPSNGAFKYSLTNNESNVRIQVYSLVDP